MGHIQKQLTTTDRSIVRSKTYFKFLIPLVGTRWEKLGLFEIMAISRIGNTTYHAIDTNIRI